MILTFGSLDVLTAILAAKNHELWPYYAVAGTVGSLIGAYITNRMTGQRSQVAGSTISSGDQRQIDWPAAIAGADS